ncbi:thioredoxin-like protein [Stereum hirsutum FP-91666 SS1]|uniref:thioredoxin-like protein n=1 Tax=Stereum hirsutum (strain FP-91666) TaxID=721885 RepID=UPI000440AA6C|nr:thioredoxin-like protein [Stereum hirsutum FP-91666 SS1]EIM88308.1 thioredoxin-like protein [Stereum hirsutum FP-91666 SS1]
MSDDEVYTGPRNPKVELLSAQLLNSAASTSEPRSDPDALGEEDIFAELEAEIENDDAWVREQGIKELRREVEYMKEMKANQHGKYSEITDEKEVIQLSAREERCVIHFYHSNFQRCQIMDKHLAAIAPKYFHTLFIRVFVENVPFLVEKLGIKVLPCVITFMNGVSKDRIVGFEELGNSDKFATATLELRLLQSDVIQKEPAVAPTVQHATSTVSGRGRFRQQNRNDDDSDFDLDD